MLLLLTDMPFYATALTCSSSPSKKLKENKKNSLGDEMKLLQWKYALASPVCKPVIEISHCYLESAVGWFTGMVK